MIFLNIANSIGIGYGLPCQARIYLWVRDGGFFVSPHHPPIFCRANQQHWNDLNGLDRLG
jgi:hypothetical protein